MAGQFPVEFSGAYYRVINRGNVCFPVFGEGRDRELILETLVDFSESFDVPARPWADACGSAERCATKSE